MNNRNIKGLELIILCTLTALACVAYILTPIKTTAVYEPSLLIKNTNNLHSARIEAEDTSTITGTYLGTVAVTSPVTLGVLDLSIDLTAQGTALSGQVSQERTLIINGTPALAGEITGSINGITPTFRIESAPFADMVSNQPISRTFTLEGEILDDGRILRGTYSEQLTGYLPEALEIEGLFQLSRSGTVAGAIGIPVLSMQAEDPSIFINTSTPIMVSFQDEDGNPVSGMGVSLTTNLGSINPAKVTTNAAGQATATFSAGNTLGTATITGTADDGQVTSIDVRVTPPIVVTITAAASLLPTHDGQTQVTVKVTDDKNNPIGNAQVALTSTLGGINPTTVQTNAGGQAVATFSAGPQPGLAKITAEYLDVEAFINVQLETPRVETVSLAVSSNQLLLNQTTQATATVKDQFDRPISGELIVFFGTLGTVSPDSALSDANGQAKTTFTAGNNPGLANVRAISGSSIGEATVKINDPSALAILSINPDHGPSSGGTAVTIQGHNFKSGIKVWFQSAACSNVVMVNATRLTCVTPAYPPGTVDVRLENPDSEESTLPDSFTFEESQSYYDIQLPVVIRRN